MKDSSELSIKSIDKLKNSGTLDDNLYFKVCVELAVKFFKDGDLDACLQAVGRCSPEYFQGPALKQMEEDSVFADNMVYLAYKLIIMNCVDVGYDVPTNQKTTGIA